MISREAIGAIEVDHQKNDIEVVPREEKGVVPLTPDLVDQGLDRETTQKGTDGNGSAQNHPKERKSEKRNRKKRKQTKKWIRKSRK